MIPTVLIFRLSVCGDSPRPRTNPRSRTIAFRLTHGRHRRLRKDAAVRLWLRLCCVELLMFLTTDDGSRHVGWPNPVVLLPGILNGSL